MIILNDGTYYEIDSKYAIFLQQSFPDVDDVHREFLAMAAWADANPKSRKTRRGMKRFITGWLNKASKEAKGISPLAAKIPKQQAAQNGKISVRDMDMDDELTHDFLGTHQENFLNKFGRCFTKAGERMTRE